MARVAKVRRQIAYKQRQPQPDPLPRAPSHPLQSAAPLPAAAAKSIADTLVPPANAARQDAAQPTFAEQLAQEAQAVATQAAQSHAAAAAAAAQAQAGAHLQQSILQLVSQQATGSSALKMLREVEKG